MVSLTPFLFEKPINVSIVYQNHSQADPSHKEAFKYTHNLSLDDIRPNTIQSNLVPFIGYKKGLNNSSGNSRQRWME